MPRLALFVDAPDQDRLEHTPQGEVPRDAHHREHRPHLQVLRQRRVQPEDREDQDLRLRIEGLQLLPQEFPMTGNTISPLRQRMLEDMSVRNFDPHT